MVSPSALAVLRFTGARMVGLLDGQVGRSRALQDPIHIGCDADALSPKLAP